MTTITGQVKTIKTNEPIGDLVVAVYLQVKSSLPTAVTAPSSTKASEHSIGSDVTDEKGKFEIEFDAARLDEVDPVLWFAVLAPNTTLTVDSVEPLPQVERLLFRKELPQLGSDHLEKLVIRLPIKQLRKHGIALPSEKATGDIDEAVEQFVTSQRRTVEFHRKLEEQLGSVWKARFEQRKDRRREARKFATKLQMTPKTLRGHPTYVKLGDDNTDAVRYAIGSGLDTIGRNENSSTIIHLSEGEFSQLFDSDTLLEDFTSGMIDREKICTLMSARRGGSDLKRVRNLIHERITDDSDEQTEYGPDDETPGAGGADPAAEISDRVRGQLADMPAGAPIINGQYHPMTVEQLSVSLPQFKLPSGPADVAAFHDFHNLQIAFQHVWTEAFDEELRRDVEDLYERVARRHGEYGVEVEGGTELEEMKDLERFLRSHGASSDPQLFGMPSDVANHIEVDLQTWNELTDVARAQISDLAGRIAVLEEEISAGRFLENGGLSLMHTRIREFRSQAETIIVSGQKSRIGRLLKGISVRMSEPYAFRYFAPNTVNFGLLLTYRQRWQPGPYQVGDLVSTIPLAPGEKRRFETKQVVKRTRAESELDKALSSRSREISTTRRADSEIVNKASTRSNFQMTAEGSFQIGIADITASSQYSLEQAQESAHTKRDFREAVVNRCPGVSK